MNENTNEIKNAAEEAAVAEEEVLTAETSDETEKSETDSGIIFIPDYGPSDTNAEQEQEELFERIQARESNIIEYVAPEMNLWQKISNFCYRNKALIIVAIVAVLVIGYIVYTSIPETYDGHVTVYVSSSDYRDSITYEVQGELEKYAEDVDGDGELYVRVSDFNVAGANGFIVMANYTIMMDHLRGEPLSMLWVVDKDLFDMMVAAFGEDLFESYEGAPLWIELTTNETINNCIERGETPRLGICLVRMTDELNKDKKLRESYDNALLILANLKEEHPEMFEAE